MGIVSTLKYAPLFHALAAVDVSDVWGADQEEQAGLLLLLAPGLFFFFPSCSNQTNKESSFSKVEQISVNMPADFMVEEKEHSCNCSL